MSHGATRLVKDSPCDSCPLRSPCSTAELACKAYVLYCQGKRWLNVERIPTHDVFKRLYRRPSTKEYAKLEKELQEISARHALEAATSHSVHCEA